MRVDHEQVPSFPKITATVLRDEAAEVTVNGISTPVTGKDLPETRENTIRLIALTARKLGRPVRATTVDAINEWFLIVHPDGLVEGDTTVETAKRQGKPRGDAGRSGRRPGPTPGPASSTGARPAPEPDPVPSPGERSAPSPPPPLRQDPVTEGAGHPEPGGEGAARSRTSASPAFQLFGAVRKRLGRKGRADREAPTVVPPVQDPANASQGLTRTEAERMWSSAIQEINQRRAPGTPEPAPEPGPPAPEPGTPAPEPASVPPAVPAAAEAAPDSTGVESGPANHSFGHRTGVTGVFERRGGSPRPLHVAPLAPVETVDTHRRIAVLSLKGGVGKTTTAVLLGSVVASSGENRTIVVDMDPYRGTLRDRVPLQTPNSLKDLYENTGDITRYSDLRRYISANGARMHALVGGDGPDAALSDRQAAYTAVAGVLEQYYDVALTDCGTGLDNPGMDDVLGLADRVVIVLEPALDAARAAASTLEWLSGNGYEHLSSTAVVAMSRVDPRVVGAAELDELERFFLGRAAGVARVPFDEHLARGGAVDFDQLRPETRDACHHLAVLSLEG
ncbi:AAA family ATPase [Nocardiopsis aegyptia]|uniref:AAA family ATPase n=1 Tax=Nocardiopsis aegyptia TaxID=220378 RepID=UPI00367134EA